MHKQQNRTMIKAFRLFLMTAVLLAGGALLALNMLWLSWRAAPVHADPGTHYVAPGGDCGVETPCYAAVQAAVDAAASDDEILVAGGIYTGVQARAGITQVVYISETLTVRGGYTTTNWTTSDPDANPTTLDAEGLGRVLCITGNVSPTIESLRITGGDATGLSGDPWGENCGGGVYVYQATATISNCTISNNSAGDDGGDGGGVYVYQGSATLSGGQVISNTANSDGGDGGGVYVYQGSAALSEVQFRSNTAGRGGGLCGYNSTVSLSGGQILSNTADWHGAGAMLLGSNSAFTQTGVTTITNNTADSGNGGGLFIQGSATLSRAHIISNSADSGGGVYFSGDSITLNQVQIISNTAGYGGGGVYVGYGSVTLSGGQVISNTAGDDGGGVYVYGSSPGATLEVNEAEIRGNSAVDDGGGVFLSQSEAALNMTGGSIISNTANGSGGGVYVFYGSVTLSGGEIQGNIASNGGGVYLSQGSATLSGGQIFSNTANSDGGGVYVAWEGATFTQTGVSTITLNTADDGGGVYVSAGSAAINSGQVLSNTANNQGGGIYVASGSAALSGGEIRGNTASNHGGGVYVGTSSATFTQTGVSTITLNTADDGGGVYVDAGTATISGGQVFSNTANNQGGGMYVASGNATLTGGEINDNTATDGGGVFVGTSSAAFTQTGVSTITLNTANDGGGVYVDAGTATISGGQVFSNTANNRGGGMYVASGNATLTGGEINDNTATDGGGVYVGTSSATFTQTGASTITYNTANDGGGVYVNVGTATVSGGQVLSNTANNQGGGVYAATGSVIVDGGEIRANNANDGGGVFSDGGTVTLSAGQVVSNTANNQGGGVYLLQSSATLSVTNVISGNTADLGSGVYVYSGTAALDGAHLLYNSGGDGNALYQAGSGTITVTNSCIVYNADTAVTHAAGPSIYAQSNWWGMDNGPSGTGPGHGDSVSTNVDYANFLAAPPAGCPTLLDLAISKSVTPTVALPGDPITYTLTFTNVGSKLARSPVITDRVPVSITNVSYSYSGTIITPTGSVSYTWQVADLASGAGGVITISGVVSSGLEGWYVITNTATITGSTVDNNLSDNEGEAGISNGKVWDGGGATNLWSDPANWDPDGVPTSRHAVLFNSTSTKDAEIDASFSGSITRLSIQAGYTGVISQGIPFTITGGLVQTSGAYHGGVEPLKVNGAFNQTGGVFTATSGLMSVSGDFGSQGTFAHHDGSVAFDGNGAQTLSGSTTFYNLTVNNTSADQQVDASGSALAVSNQLRVQDGVFLSASDYHDVQIDADGTLALSGDITVSGSWTNNGTFTHNNHTVTFDGSGMQTLSGATTFHGLTLASGATLALNADITVGGDWTNDGDLTPNGHTVTFDGSGTQTLTGATTFHHLSIASSATLSTTAAITVTGNWANSGAFTPNGRSVIFAGSGVQTLSGSTTFYNLTVDNISADQQVDASGSTLAVSNQLRVQDGVFLSASDYHDVQIDADGALALSGDITVGGDWTNDGDLTPNGHTVTFDGSGMQTLTGATTFRHLSIASSATLSTTAAITVTGNWANSGAFTPNGRSVIFAGSGAQTLGGSTTFYDLTVNNTSTDQKVDASGSTLAVSNLLHVQDGTFVSVSDFHDVQIDSNGTLELSGDVTVSSDWTNDGTFTHNSHTVTFDGSGVQTFTGSTIFYDVTVNGASTLQLVANADFGYAGTFTLGGSFDVFTNAPTTVRIAGTSSQSLPASVNSLHSLAINSGATLPASSSLNVAGNWTNNGTFTHNDGAVTFDGSGTQTLSGATTFHDLTLASDATLALNADITVGGDWTNDGGALTPNGHAVLFNGSSDQAIGGSVSTAFHDLIINDGLVGYWKLDEGSGSTAGDSSGYGHDGALTNSPTFTTTTPVTITFDNPYALELDGADDYVAINGVADEVSSAVSIAFWVKAGSGRGSNQTLVAANTDGKGNVIILSIRSNDEYQVYDGGSAAWEGDTNTDAADGTWHHLAYTSDGITGTLYVDGVDKDTHTPNYGFSSNDLWSLGQEWDNDGTSEHLDGILDDVRVYDRALSAAEIQALANGHAGFITIAGDLVRNGGVFNARGGAVTFDGSGAQTLDTDAITFYDLMVNSGSTLVDAAVSTAAFTVDNTLTNNGTLQRTQDIAGDTSGRFFQTGDYGGVSIYANGPALGNTTVSIRGNQDCTVSGDTVKRCFDISPANTTDPNATITFYYDSSEIPAGQSCGGINAYHWNGSSWDLLTKDLVHCGDDPYILTVTGVTDFSSFVLKSGGGPTVVTLQSFTARLAGGVNGFALPLALAALGAVGGMLLVWARRR